MKSNFINENISNILKPKDFKNKFYYVENTAQNLPAFIFKIKRVEYDVALCEVLYNAFSIDGASFFNVNINGDFVLPIEDLLIFIFLSFEYFLPIFILCPF